MGQDGSPGAGTGGGVAGRGRERARAHVLRWDRPPAGANDGALLGNGNLGITLHGTPERLCLTLNKGDVWDYRHPEAPVVPAIPWPDLVELARRDDRSALDAIDFNRGRTTAYPGLQPCGDLVLELARGEIWEDFGLELSLGRAEAMYRFMPSHCGKGGPRRAAPVAVEVFACATAPVVALRLPPQGPLFGRGHQGQALIRLERQHNPMYAPPMYSLRDGDLILEMAFPDGFRYAAAARVSRGFRPWEAGRLGAAGALEHSPSEPTVIYLTAATTLEGPDPAAACRRALDAVAARGFEGLRDDHYDWWDGFWARSGVELPDADADLERAWYQGLYQLGSACRSDRPPIGLQGIWNHINVPAWNSDYHFDTNIQLCYWSAFPAGHAEALLPVFRMLAGPWLEPTRAAARYYGCRGVKLPMAAGPDGTSLAGFWGSWVGANAWMAQFFFWHWRYTGDLEVLREFWPYLRELTLFYEDYLRPGPDGRLHAFPDLSPEQIDTRIGKWGEDATFTLAMCRLQFREMAAACRALGGDPAEAARWEDMAARLAPYPIRDGRYIDMRDREFPYHHRHTSRLTPIHPAGEIGLGSPAEALESGLRSYREFVSHPGEFGGFSSVLLAAVAARLGLADGAWGHLRQALSQNHPASGFHMAGWRPDASGFLQVEAGMGLPYSLCECLLQSHDGVLRLFPATPAAGGYRFHGLRAFGAFEVSAAREGGRCLEVTVRSHRGGPLRLANPFAAGAPVALRARAGGAETDSVLEGAPELAVETAPGGEYRFRALPG